MAASRAIARSADFSGRTKGSALPQTKHIQTQLVCVAATTDRGVPWPIGATPSQFATAKFIRNYPSFTNIHVVIQSFICTGL